MSAKDFRQLDGVFAATSTGDSPLVVSYCSSQLQKRAVDDTELVRSAAALAMCCSSGVTLAGLDLCFTVRSPAPSSLRERVGPALQQSRTLRTLYCEVPSLLAFGSAVRLNGNDDGLNSYGQQHRLVLDITYILEERFADSIA